MKPNAGSSGSGEPRAATGPPELSIVVAHAGRGNVSPHTDKLFPALTARGVRLHVYAWDRTAEFPRNEMVEGVRYQTVLRGGGFASRQVIVWFPFWWILITYRLVRDKPRVVMAIDFESGLAAALASLLRRVTFMYNVRDNFALRREWPVLFRRILDALDRWIMSRAYSVIFPDESRVPGRIAAHTRVAIVRNCAVDVAGGPWPPRDGGDLVVYVMGYLRESRGVGLLLDAVEQGGGTRVLAAGNCPEPALAARLREHAAVDYRGVLPLDEALLLAREADLVFTFYEPSSLINRLAVSNKWSDAMMASRAILVNGEVGKSAWLVEEGVAIACRYDVDEVCGALHWAYNRRASLVEMGRRGRALFDSGYRWDIMEQRIWDLLVDAWGASGGQSVSS